MMRALLLWSALTAQHESAQTPPVFSSGIEAVYLDAFVTRGGKPVPGLTAADFEVLDNDLLQQPKLVRLDHVSLSALLAFDVSYSTQGEKLGQLRSAAREFLNGLDPNDEAALVRFCQDVALGIAPTRDKATVAAGLESLQAGGATAIFDALYLTLRRSWGQGRPLVVLFTDGKDTASWLGLPAVMFAAQRTSAVLQVIGTQDPDRGGRDASDARELRKLAESTGGRYWKIAAGKQFEDAFRAVLEAMKTRYLLSYEPVGVQREGRHAVSVKVRKRDVEVRTRGEYWVSQ
jgi:Ca-activated chloride channel family protein